MGTGLRLEVKRLLRLKTLLTQRGRMFDSILSQVVTLISSISSAKWLGICVLTLQICLLLNMLRSGARSWLMESLIVIMVLTGLVSLVYGML